MTTGTHRKAYRLPRIPVAHIATGLVLLALTIALVAGAVLLGTPQAEASTGYLIPAVTTAKAVDHGYTGKADRMTQWQHVLRHCRQVGCTSHVPDAMRRDMGIRPGQAYRVRWGDTTFAWVRLPHGRVRTITS
jgi:hypothetical protein